MLLSLMIVCAVGTALLFFLGVFDELREIWTLTTRRRRLVAPSKAKRVDPN